MSELGGSVDGSGRRRKRFLSASEKYEMWIGLVGGESTIMEAADRAGVDRSTVMKLRQVATGRATGPLSPGGSGWRGPRAGRGAGGDRPALRA